MNSQFRRSFITLFVIGIGALAAQDGLAQSARENAADAEWLTMVLEIKAGTIVGEIGAGSGELTFALAKVAGESGRVFTNELNKDRVKAIENEAAKSNVKNVTVVEGRAAETNFPDQCCDALFMRNVYHHFGDPPAMNASLLKSLRPGGRLAVIDFTPPPPSDVSENPPGRRGEDNHHGITVATLEKELKAAGFEIVSAETKNRAVTVVARRPTS
jgi:ubiquinone/menaquinone biosynthesis C-methylase UbiE